MHATFKKYKEYFKQVLVSSTLMKRGVVYMYFSQAFYTPNSKSLKRAWSRGIVDRTKQSVVLYTMPRLHARFRLLE